MIRDDPKLSPLAWTRFRQISFGMCLGMKNPQIAEALGITRGSVNEYVGRILDESGMHSRMEFAMQQNAAVRERLYTKPLKRVCPLCRSVLT